MGRRNRPLATTLLIIRFAGTPIRRLSCGITQDNFGITEIVAFKETAVGEILKTSEGGPHTVWVAQPRRLGRRRRQDAFSSVHVSKIVTLALIFD